MGCGEDSTVAYSQDPGWSLVDWISMDSIVKYNMEAGVNITWSTSANININIYTNTKTKSSTSMQLDTTTTAVTREFQMRSMEDFQTQLESMPESDPFLIDRILHSSSSFAEIIPKLESNSPYDFDRDHLGLHITPSDSRDPLTATEWMRSLLETQRRTETIQSARLNQAPGCLLCGGRLVYIKDLDGEQWKASAMERNHGGNNHTAVMQTELDKTLICIACHIDSFKDQNSQRNNSHGAHNYTSTQRQQQPVRVRFTQYGSKSAFLAGSFSHWTQFHVMDCIHSCFSESSDSSSSQFETMLDILPGMYYYLFHVDGEWMHDPKKLAYRLPSGVTLNCLNVYNPVEKTKVPDHMSMCV